MADSYQQLAREIVDLRKRVNARAKLIRSTIEGGAIPIRDELTGALTGELGQLYDGTYGTAVFSGPIPPTPSWAGDQGEPLEAVLGGVQVRWQGAWVQTALDAISKRPTVAPGDLVRVEVYVGTDRDTLADDFHTMRSSITSPRGGDVFVPWGPAGTPLYACLVARSHSGKASVRSAIVGPVNSGAVGLGDLGFDLSEYAGGTTISAGPDEPEDPLVGDIWLEEVEPGQHLTRRWSGATWQILEDQSVTQALEKAIAAQAAAEQAGIDALAAKAIAGGKVTLYRQATAPTGGTYVTNVDLWIDSDDNQLYLWNGSIWAASSDTRISAAVTAAATAQATADGKMRIFPQATPPVGLTADDVGDLWIETDNDNKSWTWALVSGSTYGWVARQIGNAAIQPQSLVASSVLATGTVSAALLEALLVLTTSVVAGNPTGEHVRLSSSGLSAYIGDPTGGVPNEVARFGRNSGGRNDSGELTWNIDQEGRITGRTISTREWPIIRGVPLNEDLLRRAEGLVQHAVNGKLQNNIALEFGILELGFPSKAYRNYRIVVNAFSTSTVANGEITYRVRYSTDGSRPTVNSPILAERDYTIPVASRTAHHMFDAVRQNPVGFGPYLKLLLTVARGPGTTTGTVETARTPASIHVYDEGILNFASGINTNDGSVGGTSVAAPSRQVYEDFASWGRSFRGDGTKRTDTTDLVQGLDPSGFNGDGRAMAGWPDLVPMLTGAARIESVFLYLYNYRWWWNFGGEAIIGTHGNASAVEAFGAPNVARIRVSNWGQAEGRWIDITGWAAEFQSGATRGITLGPSSSGDLGYYGRFVGPGDAVHPDLRPKLQIVYYK